MSPTARTLTALREKDCLAQVVERWCSFSRRRIDLFSCIDLIAVDKGRGILGIQCTSGTNHSARLVKAVSEPMLRIWMGAGGLFEIWSWSQRVVRNKDGGKAKRKRWTPRITVLGINREGNIEQHDHSNPAQR